MRRFGRYVGARGGKSIRTGTEAVAALRAVRHLQKEFMIRHHMPTAAYKKCVSKDEAIAYAKELRAKNSSGAVVLKADGLCQGKGVVIAEEDSTIVSYCEEIFDKKIFGDLPLVVEEFWTGLKFRNFALLITIPLWRCRLQKTTKKSAKEKKEPILAEWEHTVLNVQGDVYYQEVEEKVMKPFLKGIQEEQLDFRGVIFFGLMVTEDGVKVLEFNTRFGDLKHNPLVLVWTVICWKCLRQLVKIV